MNNSKEIEFKVGRRDQDGRVRLSTYLPRLLTLNISYGAERAASVMLTHAQVQQLQRALCELEPLLEAEEISEDAEQWNGGERRVIS